MNGGVPTEHCEDRITIRIMRGTVSKPARCCAGGAICQRVPAIYDQRPTPCRELQASWGMVSLNLNVMRLASAGLAPLTKDDWPYSWSELTKSL